VRCCIRWTKHHDREFHYERSETTEHGMSQMRYSPYSLAECGPSQGLEGRLFGLVLRSQGLIVSGYVKHAIGQRLPKDFGRVVWGLRGRDESCAITLIAIWASFDGCCFDGWILITTLISGQLCILKVHKNN
jgi:hypothetical protein